MLLDPLVKPPAMMERGASSNSTSRSMSTTKTAVPPAPTNIPNHPSKLAIFRYISRLRKHSAHTIAIQPVLAATPIYARESSILEEDVGEQIDMHDNKDALIISTDLIAPPAMVAANFLKEGMMLVAHPLVEQPFPKCVLLIINTNDEEDHISMVILNTPQKYSLGKTNYLFPEHMRQLPCSVGGATVSLLGLPPVPNYLIIHPFPSITNSRVLISADGDGDVPVCLSTGADIPEVLKFIERDHTSIRDFRFFIGTVEMNRSEVAEQVAMGFWMPVQSSPAFVHNASRLGREGLWHDLLNRCGGEFSHMSLVGRHTV
jgi:hypothetical protein